MTIIDNVNNTLRDDLARSIKEGGRLCVAASCFSIYAYEALRDTLEKVKEFRFLFTEPTFTTSTATKAQREFYIPKLSRERAIYGSEFEVKLRNELKQKAIAKECAEWIRRKAVFKSNMANEVMQRFIVTDDVGYTPIMGFTTVDLGVEKGNRANTAIMKSEAPTSRLFVEMFDYLWSDSEKRQIVTDEVVESITSAYRENSPEFIYFVTLYNIFHEFLEDVDVLPKEGTGFRKSLIWNKLYDFQKDAVLAIISKLEKYNGCILADSVGLGKTFTALAVVKYYECRNDKVLVLCPKKLYDNWDTYRHDYTNNPLAGDRLGYEVLYHTDLSRERGTSNGVNLERINWGNYDLVVIDESHNFRNGGQYDEEDGDDEDERQNRYVRLIRKVIRSGVKTKVLMLSATPVNNRFSDLRNQLQLAYTDYATGFDELVGGREGLTDIFRNAQKAFTEWHNEHPDGNGTIADLQSRLDPKFFLLLDAVTIARSRKHIQKFYNMAAIGKFPERLAPISRNPEVVANGTDGFFAETINALESVKLAAYTPSVYIQPSKLHKYETGQTNKRGGALLGIVERERGILKLMLTQLLKRLESSLASFRLTLERVNSLVVQSIDAVEAFKKGKKDATATGFEPGDADEDEESAIIGQGSNRIRIADMDYERWLEDLKCDRKIFKGLLEKVCAMGPKADNKLMTLLDEIRNKVAHPINPGNKKVIVFTAFADTANYLYQTLSGLVKDELGLECGLVTGGNGADTTLKFKRGERMDFNKVLTLFSPRSKERDVLYPDLKDKEIDILIATDCVSEGQNLQDCDFLVNYDIHWNPVRIIQRFGRIDRIGSKNEKIQLVNYWPPMELDEYIRLQSRVQARAKAISLTTTGTATLDPEKDTNLDYRNRQLKQLRDSKTMPDIENPDSGFNIMDLGLNEFRMDLVEYIKAGHKVEKSPLGLHAVAQGGENAPKGVIYILKNKSKSVDIDSRNRIHPFYMVYVGDDGGIVIDHLKPKDMLDRLRLVCKGRSKPETPLCREFNKETRDGLNMKKYSALLGKAVESIVRGKEKSAYDDFYGGGNGDLFADRNKVKGLDDFELVSFVVVR